MAGGRRLLSLVVLAVLLLLSPRTGAAPALAAPGVSAPSAARGTGPRVPVVLVHGLTGGGPQVWGDRGPGGRGLYGRLIGAGYSPGRTLFTYDYAETGGPDYAVLAQVGLERVVRRALEASGEERVDIVTFGSGALAARYWAAVRDGPALLRNLVMIAPPNHGLLQADLIKVLYHTHRLTRTGPGPTPSPAGEADRPRFLSETQYVGRRAGDYRSLYAEYLLWSRLLGGGPGPEGSRGAGGAAGSAAPPPDFELWLARERPSLVEEAIYAAEVPAGPGDGGLTLAYYELLSLRVGRYLHLAHAVTVRRPPPLPGLEDILAGGWREALVSYLKRLLLDWGVGKARELLSRERAGAGLGLAELLTGLDAGSAGLGRLVPEHLVFPGPGGAGAAAGLGATPGSGRVLLCNWFLREWQEREAAARGRGARHVTIAGSCPNLFGAAGLGVGPNDLVVEVVSALTAPHPADSFILREGLLAVHRALPGDGAVVSAVLAALGAGAGPESDGGQATAGGPGVGGPGSKTGGSGGGTGSGVCHLWGPAYQTLATVSPGEGGNSAAGTVIVEVSVADPVAAGLDGLSALAWVAAVPTGPDGRPVPGEPPSPEARFSFEEAGRSADGLVLTALLSAPAPGPGRALLLGVRLAPDPAAGPAYLTLGRYLGRDTRLPFSYSVTTRTAAQRDGAPDAAARPPAAADAPTGKPGGDPDEDPGSPSGSAGGAPSGRAELVPGPDPPPLIKVVRVTRMTTTRRESRVVHARWEWDFGDGERLVDEDPAHSLARVEHVYRTAGTFKATAVSWANDGRLLRELSWDIEVGPEDAGGEPVVFEAETIQEPEVRLALKGPVKWVTGKPARFELEAEVGWPPHTRRQVVRAYPGWTFDVVWEKPGRFEVRAAITVKQSYEFPERRLTVWNTYVVVAAVEVLTAGLTE